MAFFQNLFDSYGLVAGYILLVLENMGMPLPSEIVYLYGIDQVKKGSFSFWYLVFLFSSAHMIGSVLAYYLGLVGNSFASKKLSSDNKIALTKKKVEAWYKSYGSISSFFVRFIGYVRPWSSFIAGFGKEKFGPFIVWSTLGTVLFNIIVMYFSEWLVNFWHNYQWSRTIIIAGFAFFFVGIWFLFPYLNKRNKN